MTDSTCQEALTLKFNNMKRTEYAIIAKHRMTGRIVIIYSNMYSMKEAENNLHIAEHNYGETYHNFMIVEL